MRQTAAASDILYKERYYVTIQPPKYKEKTKDKMLAFQTGFTRIHGAGKARSASDRPQ